MEPTDLTFADRAFLQASLEEIRTVAGKPDSELTPELRARIKELVDAVEACLIGAAYRNPFAPEHQA